MSIIFDAATRSTADVVDGLAVLTIEISPPIPFIFISQLSHSFIDFLWQPFLLLVLEALCTVDTDLLVQEATACFELLILDVLIPILLLLLCDDVIWIRHRRYLFFNGIIIRVFI